MSRIITISREFGSGGREFGKRLAEFLNVPCYDRELIDIVAKERGLNPEYVSEISESDIQTFYPSTIGHRFSFFNNPANQNVKTIMAQKDLIVRLAQKGDCVIVGHCADVILEDMNPFNIFVYANKDSKLKRCIERAREGEDLSPHQMEHKMKNIDKERQSFRSLFTDDKWGDKENYHLCINTSDRTINNLIAPIASYVDIWFGKR